MNFDVIFTIFKEEFTTSELFEKIMQINRGMFLKMKENDNSLLNDNFEELFVLLKECDEPLSPSARRMSELMTPSIEVAPTAMGGAQTPGDNVMKRNPENNSGVEMAAVRPDGEQGIMHSI